MYLSLSLAGVPDCGKHHLKMRVHKLLVMALPHQHTKALVQESLGTHSSTLIAPHTHTHTHTHILWHTHTHTGTRNSHTHTCVCVCVCGAMSVLLWVPRDSCTSALVCWWGRAITSSLWTLILRWCLPQSGTPAKLRERYTFPLASLSLHSF